MVHQVTKFLLLTTIFYATNACHEALHISKRRKRSTSETSEALVMFFTECMMNTSNITYDWYSATDWTIQDSNWYYYTDESDCAGDEYSNETECWMSRVTEFLDESLSPTVQDCIMSFATDADETTIDYYSYAYKKRKKRRATRGNRRSGGGRTGSGGTRPRGNSGTTGYNRIRPNNGQGRTNNPNTLTSKNYISRNTIQRTQGNSQGGRTGSGGTRPKGNSGTTGYNRVRPNNGQGRTNNPSTLTSKNYISRNTIQRTQGNSQGGSVARSGTVNQSPIIQPKTTNQGGNSNSQQNGAQGGNSNSKQNGAQGGNSNSKQNGAPKGNPTPKPNDGPGGNPPPKPKSQPPKPRSVNSQCPTISQNYQTELMRKIPIGFRKLPKKSISYYQFNITSVVDFVKDYTVCTECERYSGQAPKNCYTSRLNQLTRYNSNIKQTIQLVNGMYADGGDTIGNCDSGVYWTEWFNNPVTSSGDDESLASIRVRYRNQVCDNPAGIQAQLSNTQQPYGRGNNNIDISPELGLICQNSKQSIGQCKNYRVRFCCRDYIGKCSLRSGWTQWFDETDPSNGVEHELLARLRIIKPGKICSNPTAVGAQLTSGLPYQLGGEKITLSLDQGLICIASQQSDKSCEDYQVRFCCPPVVGKCLPGHRWTKWINSVVPYGDNELLSGIRTYPQYKCKSIPSAIEAETAKTRRPYIEGGDIISYLSPEVGLLCLNHLQPDGKCRDYRVRFCCDIPRSSSGSGGNSPTPSSGNNNQNNNGRTRPNDNGNRNRLSSTSNNNNNAHSTSSTNNNARSTSNNNNNARSTSRNNNNARSTSRNNGNNRSNSQHSNRYRPTSGNSQG